MILYKTFNKSDSSTDLDKIIILSDMLRELRFSSRLDQYRFKVKVKYSKFCTTIEAWIVGTKETISEIESFKAADIALNDLLRRIERRCSSSTHTVSGTDMGYVAQERFGSGRYKGTYGRTHKKGR